jgi:hypothetical protein
MKTAVEWLEDQLGIKEIVADPIYSNLMRIFAEAKQIEKEQFDKLKDFDTWKEWKD